MGSDFSMNPPPPPRAPFIPDETTAGASRHAAEIERYSAAQDAIAKECDAIKAMLLEKNNRYGNSALSPLRVFSSADTTEQIRVRIDDKLSRLKYMNGGDTEDVIMDLIGYLILYRIATKEQ